MKREISTFLVNIFLSCALKTEFLFATILYTRSGYFKNFVQVVVARRPRVEVQYRL